MVDIVRASKLIDAEAFRAERDVSVTKWFDYRFMAPVEATTLFYSEYRKIYREAWRSNFDAEQATRKRATPVGGLWADSREFSSVWRARQIADSFGLPYAFFIREAMQAAFRRGVRKPPRPNQLYRTENCEFALNAWEELKQSAPLVSSLPQYHIDLFRGLPAQVDHQDWVVMNLKSRLARPFAIAQACAEKKIITYERAYAEFSPHVMESVHDEMKEMNIKATPVVRQADFWPSCFGLPHAPSDDSPICNSCQLHSGCVRASAKVVEKIRELPGHADPKLARKQEKGRIRTARCRAKKKALTTMEPVMCDRPTVVPQDG